MKKTAALTLLAAALAFTACNEKKTDGLNNKAVDKTAVDNTATAMPEAPEGAEIQHVTVKGSVLEIKNGKDGYTAKIKDDNGTFYFITVSRANLKDPNMYREIKVNDVIITSGEQWEMNGETHIKAITIMI